MQPLIREATPEDLVSYYGEMPKQSVRAFVAVLEGKPIGIAGVMYNFRTQEGRVKIFSEMKPEARRFPKAMIKGARQMLAALAQPGMVAVANPEEPRSQKLLLRLGFIPSVMTPHGQLFIWGGRR